MPLNVNDSPDKPAAPSPASAQVPAALNAADNAGNRDYAKSNLIQIPAINLPKGGGALKSIDETFKVNAANGTASSSISIPLSRSRNDFAPSLSLNYNSGGGNSPFGLGWNLSLSSIRRRTDKRLPRYQDANDSDIFQLAGADDLVMRLVQDGSGAWQPDTSSPGDLLIKRYRPRIESAFALIEQVNSPANGMYWKTTSRDNTVTFYGLSSAARVADPADPTHVFEWWPELTYDDKGNCYQFFYVPEDLVNVPDLLHEGNRLNGNQRLANIYLKRVVYGNSNPYNPASGFGPAPATGPASPTAPYEPFVPDGRGYHFSLVLDYGDHDWTTPTPTPSGPWGCRLDPFSNGKPGFDWRTYRLCRRFLMFHNFPELDTQPVLVRSLALTYQYYNFQPVADPYTLTFAEADLIVAATETGWSGTAATGYLQSSYPPLSFSYQLPVWNTAVQAVNDPGSVNLPQGLSRPYQFTDLYDEGIAGVLSEQSEGWYYNSNLGDGTFTPASLVSPKPSFTGLNGGGLQLQSLTGDGRKFIVSTRPPNQGYFQLTEPGEWLPFMSFDRYPRVDINDPNIKFIDLNGDGMPEIVLSEEQVFTWYPAAGVAGYDAAELAPKPFDEEKGPAIVFADPVESIFLADMNGDGLTDIVRIRNGEVSYWLNLGWGCFGAKVNMSNAPVFDRIDAFNPDYLHLADINGTGATDILYLGKDKFRAWLNLSGNAWGPPFEMPAFPATASPNDLDVADFLGNGTSCIIWSSPLAANADSPLRYVDLMGGNKPYLMTGYSNGMGKQVALTYKSSTYFYLRDKLAGTPWITSLCFPVQCVAAVLTTDAVSGTSYANSYTYHHGYYDHPEKEYRGFGRVEQTDTDDFDTDAAADQVPVLTKTWFHTGAYFGMDRILHGLAGEYFKNPAFTEYNLPEPMLPMDLTADEAREAVRACKGMVLRQEVYALDAAANPALAAYPYTVAEHNNDITQLQPRGPNLYAAFLSVESQHIAYQYERNPSDPRIAHTLNTAFDIYGSPVDSYSVVYPRQPVNPATPGGQTLPDDQPLPAAVLTEQQNTYIVYTHYAYTGQLITATTYRLPVACETLTYEVTGLMPAATYFSIEDFTAPSSPPTLTLLKQQRTLFLQNDLKTILPLYTMASMGLVYQQYHLAFNTGVTALAGKATPTILQTGQYLQSTVYIGAGYFPATDPTDDWWAPSGRVAYLNAGSPLPFFLPYQYLDAYGYATTLGYDSHWLLPVTVTDALNNTTTASPIDYRVLAPQTVTDPNGNATDASYDALGVLVAIALRGKGEGDSFDPGFTSDLSNAQVAGFFSDPYTNGPTLLQGATTRYIYDFVTGGPFSTGIITRQIHAGQTPDPRVDIDSVPYQYSFEYTDGLGRLAMKKVQADANTGAPGGASCDGGNPPQHQWIGNGKIVYNNKGKPVMQYEPYFSSTPAYEEAPAIGVSQVLHYDPLGRVIRNDFPDGSFSTTVFDGWVQILYDRNDTVKDSSWYLTYSGSPDPQNVAAAGKALADYNTPGAAHLDPLGRNFYTVSYNIVGGSAVFYAAQTVLDLENNPLEVIDALGNTVMQMDYDLLNRPIHQVSMDAGERWTLHDCMDKPFMQWDNNGPNSFVLTNAYDALHRPLQSNVSINGAPYLYAYNIYGEGITIHSAADTTNNLRGRLYRQFDGSGLVTHYCYDFKGNLVQSSRIFAKAYQATNPLAPVVPWTGTSGDPSLLTGEEWVSLTAYDALNRPMLQTRPFIPAVPNTIIPPPYNAAAVNGADITIPGYGESGALNTVNLYYGAGTTATAFVNRIGHNEKGQRLCIQYGNNTVTRYTYDPATFRLTRLLTTANMGTSILQDMHYYYDPAGNITYTIDNAQPTITYDGQQVPGDADYTYDALYRLIRATGREQITQNTFDESPSNTDYRNYPFDAVNPLPAPTDSLAMRPYTQLYAYDAVGNMTSLRHVAGMGSYTRVFAYNNNAADRAAFGIPPATVMNNQLLATTIGAGTPVRYGFDGHGNMTDLIQLPAMAWDFKDAFVSCTQQVVSAGSGLTTYYNYDGTGIRSRKVTVGAAPAGGKPPLLSERLYIGGFEVFRSYDNAGNISLQRETIHVMDDKGRIAMVDNKTVDTGHADTTTLNTYYPRYQYGNQLGSAMYELDGNANIITYEEYHPFGTTSYQAATAALDVPAKRYRYTGKERDEESGLNYHGARYYAPWLCRWTAADPIGVGDGLNVYSYVNNNPPAYSDPSGKEKDDSPISSDDNANNPLNYSTFEEFKNNAQGPFTEEGLQQTWDEAHPEPQLGGMTGEQGTSMQGKSPESSLDASASSEALPPKKPDEILETGVRAEANGPREHYSNMVARDYAEQGMYRLAEVAEAGHFCAFCHLQHFESAREADANLDLRNYNDWAVTLESLRNQAALMVASSGWSAVALPEAVIADESIVIEGSGRGPKVAPNTSTVPLPNPGETDMAYGTRAHQELPRIVGETNPGAGGTYNVAPGLTGEDLANPTGMNARYGEMKSIWGKQSPMIRQAKNWGFNAQEARYFFYDRETGTVFEGVIQTEKYPSGRFR